MNLPETQLLPVNEFLTSFYPASLGFLPKALWPKGEELQRLWMRIWYLKNREQSKHTTWVNRLKKNFGITEKDYNTLLMRQENVCAICKGKDKGMRLAVDHDHKTGKVRGLLCRRCNQGIGRFEDSPELLTAAANYLCQSTQKNK